MSTTKSPVHLKPGEIVQHREHGFGVVSRFKGSNDAPHTAILHHVPRDWYRVDTDLTGWERVETVKPGHVQVRVDDLDLSGWETEDDTNASAWNDRMRAVIRAAKAVAAQDAESTPPADEQATTATITTSAPCAWCGGSVNVDLHLSRDKRHDVTAVVSADGGHTCPPTQPDEPQEFGARVTVTRPDGTHELWLRFDKHTKRPWVSEAVIGERSWNQVKQRGTVTLGWGD